MTVVLTGETVENALLSTELCTPRAAFHQCSPKNVVPPKARWPEEDRSGSRSPSLFLSEVPRPYVPPPRGLGCSGDNWDAERGGGEPARASLLRAAQTVCHRTPRPPGLGDGGIALVERRRGEGPFLLLEQEVDLSHAAIVIVKTKSTELRRAHQRLNTWQS